MIAKIVRIHALGALCRVQILWDELPLFTGLWARITLVCYMIIPSFLLIFISYLSHWIHPVTASHPLLQMQCFYVSLPLCCYSLLGIANEDLVVSSAIEMLDPFPDFGAGHWLLNAGKVPGHATNVYLAGWSSH